MAAIKMEELHRQAIEMDETFEQETPLPTQTQPLPPQKKKEKHSRIIRPRMRQFQGLMRPLKARSL